MATSTMRRSSHGLTSGGEEGVNWRVHGACGRPDVDPDWWSADGANAIGRARHICLKHCLVLADCTVEREDLPASLRKCVTLAGVHHSKNGEPNQDQPLAKVCPLCSDKPDPAERLRAYWRARKKPVVETRTPGATSTVGSLTKRRTPDPSASRRCEAPASL